MDPFKPYEIRLIDSTRKLRDFSFAFQHNMEEIWKRLAELEERIDKLAGSNSDNL